MADGRISSGGIAMGAWRDAFTALPAMRMTALTAFLALTLINLLVALHGDPHSYVPAPGGDPLPHLLDQGTVLLASGLAHALLLTPFAIAVHRFVLLGERAHGYVFEFRQHRFRRFALFTCLLEAIYLTPFAGLLVFASLFRVLPPGAAALLGLGVAIACIAGAVVVSMLGVRLTLLFPAVAIDAPGAGWSRSLEQSSGHAWRIFFALALTLLIGLLAGLAAELVVRVGAAIGGPGHPIAGTILDGAAQAAGNLIVTTALVAAASRLYRRLGDPMPGLR